MLLPDGIAWYFIVLHYITLYRMVSYVMLWYPVPLHSIACYLVADFGTRAVPRKATIYFILLLTLRLLLNVLSCPTVTVAPLHINRVVFHTASQVTLLLLLLQFGSSENTADQSAYL